MSQLLAFESSAEVSSLAVLDDAQISIKTWLSERRHHAHIFEALKILPAEFGSKMQNQTIIVGTGPGSHGGIRVSLAVADGLALAWNCAAVGISSWEALPIWWESNQKNGWILADARRGDWAICPVENARVIASKLILLPYQDAKNKIENLLAQGELVVSCETKEKLTTAQFPEISAYQTPEAQFLLSAWQNRSDEEQNKLLQKLPQPFYLREAHITLPKNSILKNGD